MIDKLLNADHWPFLRVDYHSQERPVDDLSHYALWCERLWDSHTVWTPNTVPHPVGKDRVVLHGFAGRRRVGDFQWYLEELMQPVDAVTLHVVSLDITIDSHFGDLSRDDVQAFWL